MISPWNVPMGALWGQPWHGRYEAGGLTLDVGGTLAGALYGGADCHLVDFGLPGPDAVWTSSDGRQKLLKRAILHGRDKRYSPLSTEAIGAMSWLYRAADGAVWRLIATPDTAQQLIGGVMRTIIDSLSVRAQRFGLIGGAPASASTVATRDTTGDAPETYTDAGLYWSGTLWPTWIVNASPSGNYAAIQTYFYRKPDFERDPSPPYPIFQAVDLCWQAQVSGGSATEAPTVTLSFVGAAAAFASSSTTHPDSGGDWEIWGPHDQQGLPGWPTSDTADDITGAHPTLVPSLWPAGCSWTLDVSTSGADRTLTIAFAAVPALQSTIASRDTHTTRALTRLFVATDTGLVALAEKETTDIVRSRTQSVSGSRHTSYVVTQHYTSDGLGGYSWVTTDTEQSGDANLDYSLEWVTTETTTHALKALVGASEIAIEQFVVVETDTEAGTYQTSFGHTYDWTCTRNGQAYDKMAQDPTFAPASLLGAGISGVLSETTDLPIGAANCLAYAVPWRADIYQGQPTARYALGLIGAPGLANLAAPVFLDGPEPVEYARGGCSLNPISGTPAAGDRVGWI